MMSDDEKIYTPKWSRGKAWYLNLLFLSIKKSYINGEYECGRCGEVNKIRLPNKPGEYIVECSSCGAKNRLYVNFK